MDQPEEIQLRLARAFIGAYDSLVQYLDAAGGGGPANGPPLPVEVAAEDLQDAMSELQMAWAAISARTVTPISPVRLN